MCFSRACACVRTTVPKTLNQCRFIPTKERQLSPLVKGVSPRPAPVLTPSLIAQVRQDSCRGSGVPGLTGDETWPWGAREESPLKQRKGLGKGDRTAAWA